MDRWFLVMSNFTVSTEVWWPHLDEHLAFQEEQHRSGRIVMSGPGSDDRGIWLVRASSVEEAESLAAADPFAARGMTESEVIEWQVHQIMGIGSFTTAGMPQQYLDEKPA